MHNIYLVSVLSSDKTGLVSAISGCLFDLGINLGSTSSVSYTHLTLPTMRLRCRSRWSPYH